MMPRLFDRLALTATVEKCRDGYRHLTSDQRGAVAIWVGISLTVFIGCAGLAVDTARGYMLKARLSQALDAAALAGAKSLGSGHVADDINMFFKANFPAAQLDAVVEGGGPTITPADVDTAVSSNNTVKVSAKATTGTTLMAVLGFKTMTVSAEATAVRGINGLDVVVAIDLSGSMCQPSCTKMQGAQDAAKILVDTVYKDPNPKTVTIEGVTYSLLNIGIVPWNGKVNVQYNSVLSKGTYTGVTPKSVNEFTNPVTGKKQNQVYKPNNSEVLLLNDPGSDWKGGVYARYIDDNDATNDADLKLGYGTYGGKAWMAYEPVSNLEGEPIDSADGPYNADNWSSTTGGISPDGTNWYSSTIPNPTNPSKTITNPNRPRNCFGAYWNDALTDPNRPIAVPNAPSYWKLPNPIEFNSSDSFKVAGANECYPTLKQGILPMQAVKDAVSKKVVDDAIIGLYNGSTIKPEGSTVAAQGLMWAWEVLMPGEPFTEAKPSVPFNRTQAIVLLTDGEGTGFNGDAYKAVYGPDTGANSNTLHGTLKTLKNCDGTNYTAYNNLNGRLAVLADAIKGSDPEKGVKIYVVQYQAASTTLRNLLRMVATKCEAPYYYQATDEAALKKAFGEIAASLSVLRLEK